MDVLTDILQSMRLKGRLYFRTELTAPWGIHVPHKPDVARFHIVIRGNGWLHVEGQPQSLPMANGDLVVIPHGAGHHILDEPSTPSRELDDVLAEVDYAGEGVLVFGGGGMGCSLVCGEFAFDSDTFNPLIDNLPSILQIKAGDNFNNKWLDHTLGFIAHEAATDLTGAHAIIDRLAEIILIQVIRAYVESSDSQIPFLAALGDDQISRALGLMHSNPSYSWSIHELGQQVGMSRSSFSRRFAELVGITPYQYLTQLRLQKAAQQLQLTDASIMQIAVIVGYESEAAFSNAFHKHYNMRPGEYRRRKQL